MKSAWIHRLALLTAWATLPLLFLGGLVTTKGAALAVPDWPTTFGTNMFLFPWSKMTGGIFYEHSHRLAGSAVGLFTIFLVVSLWIWEPRKWLRWLGFGALLLVCVQGVVGGLRVVLLERTLAIVHAGLAQLFFATAVALAFLTSKESKEFATTTTSFKSGWLPLLSAAATLGIFLQGLLGAFLRHTGALLLPHITGAVFVTALLITLGYQILCAPHLSRSLGRLWGLLAGLLACQLLLGAGAYAVTFTSVEIHFHTIAAVAIRTFHVVVGGLMLATGLVLTIKTYGERSWDPARVRTLVSERISA